MHNIALIEDDFDLRENLRSVFQQSTKLNLEFDTDSIEKCIRFYRTHPAPQLILLDLSLPGIDGIDGLPILKKHLPDTEIIVHTILDEDDKIFQAICNGASGYLLKTTDPASLEQHILQTIEEKAGALSPSVARRIMRYFQGKGTVVDPEYDLSDKEHSIVNMLTEAFKYQEIADKLGMTIDGVRYHVKHIYLKLQVKSRSELVRNLRKRN